MTRLKKKKSTKYPISSYFTNIFNQGYVCKREGERWSVEIEQFKDQVGVA